MIERLALPNVRAVPLAALEAADPALLRARADRSRVEYYFTLSPIWSRYVLDQAGVDGVTYLDSDLLFYSSPDPVFEEMGDASVEIVPHRFPDSLRHMERHGIYNVGLIAYRNDARARAVLDRWREQCLSWCFDRVEAGKFADQKYLDEWPSLPGVRVSRHPGVGLAPWNWMNYTIDVRGDAITVDGAPLVFFHFQGMKLFNAWLFQPSEATYPPMPRRLRTRLYGGYLSELAATKQWLARALPGAALQHGTARYPRMSTRQLLGQIWHGFLRPRIGSTPL